MNFITQYSKTIVKYDLINKFQYKSLASIPNINYINLYFNFKKCDIKLLSSALIALELLTLQKSSLIVSKTSSITLKLKKGSPVGCKVTLRKKNMNLFLFKLINLNKIPGSVSRINNAKMFSFKLKNILIFNELEQNYQFFKNLLNLNVNVKLTANNFKELMFLLKSYKLTN
jgi:large subunit ribosomal protein L5